MCCRIAAVRYCGGGVKLDGAEAWFLINPDAQPVTESIGKAGFRQVSDLLGDSLMAQSAADFTVRVPGVNLACMLLMP